MIKGILRVPSGGTSQELLSALKTHFPGYSVETYSAEEPDYRRSYIKKINSYSLAFEYLINAYPRPVDKSYFSNETVRAYVNECRVASVVKVMKSVSGLQKELKNFTTKLIDMVRFIWNETNKDAVILLNEAEQYVLMLEGRPNLATVTPMSLGEAGEYVVQFDQSLVPYDQQIIKELTQIKMENYPKTPAWFRKLADPTLHFIQAYFCHYQNEVAEPTEDFAAFLEDWNTIKVNALNLNNDLEQIAGQILPLPTWFSGLSTHRREMIAVLASESLSEIEINKRLLHFKDILAYQEYKDSYQQISRLPQWYWVLPRHQQYFLECALKSKDRIEDVISFLCSRHRTLPMPANFATHCLYILNQKGELHRLYSEKYRSSHIATRDGISLKWPKSVLRRHFLANLNKIMSQARPEQLALLQTLISPLGSDHIPFFDLSSLIPDYELHKMARLAVEDRSKLPLLVQINHPFNVAKLILYTVANDPDILAFLKAVEYYFDKLPDDKSAELKELVACYKEVLDSGIGSTNIFDYVGRELFLSSLEQLIILAIDGYSYGSCVSGKDRKAIESIHTDAMFLYKKKYGCWPKFEDTSERRADFVAIVVSLYISRHQHEHAGQNAPGSEGIKTPSNYFPTDIVEAINKRLNNKALEYDDLLATNNELKKVAKGSSSLPKEALLCKLVAIELGEQKCTQLYDKLYVMLNDENQFMPNKRVSRFFTSAPEGIKAIKTLMNAPETGSNNITRMAGILEIILSRPVFDSSRTKATKSVYALRQLLDQNTPNLNLDEIANQLLTNWMGYLMMQKNHADVRV